MLTPLSVDKAMSIGAKNDIVNVQFPILTSKVLESMLRSLPVTNRSSNLLAPLTSMSDNNRRW